MGYFLKSADEIEKLRRANLAVSAVLDAVEAACKPGASTWDLDEIADHKLKELGAKSAFLDYHGYPKVLCASVNEVVVHGIPRKDVVLKSGDIVGIDFGCFVDGFCGDSARTIPIGEVSPETRKLIDATRESLELAIKSVCREIGCRTSAGRSSRTSSRSASRWCAPSSDTGSARRCTRTRRCPTTARRAEGSA